MSTLVGKPVIEDVRRTSVAIQLQIFVRPVEWQGAFNRIEVWRSRMSPSGPFEARTADQWAPAVLPRCAGPVPALSVSGKQVLLTGLSLLLRINHKDTYTISFIETDPITYLEAASDINAQSAGAFTAYVDENGDMVLSTMTVGTGACIEVVGGDAAPLLGLPTTSPENIAYGQDAHIALSPALSAYAFVDIHGSRDCFYRARFVNTLTGAVGAFNVPFTLGEASSVCLDHLVQGYIELVGADGRPLFNQLVQVYPAPQTNMVEGKLVTGVQQAVRTDTQGRARFTLIRGVHYTVSVSGTDIVRQVAAPTDPAIAVFSLLDPAVGIQDDLFTVDRPKLVYAEKRSF